MRMHTWPSHALILLKIAKLHFAEDNFVKKLNTKSIIWKYFSVRANSKGVPLEGEIENPVCDNCNKCVPAKLLIHVCLCFLAKNLKNSIMYDDNV